MIRELLAHLLLLLWGGRGVADHEQGHGVHAAQLGRPEPQRGEQALIGDARPGVRQRPRVADQFRRGPDRCGQHPLLAHPFALVRRVGVVPYQAPVNPPLVDGRDGPPIDGELVDDDVAPIHQVELLLQIRRELPRLGGVPLLALVIEAVRVLQSPRDEVLLGPDGVEANLDEVDNDDRVALALQRPLARRHEAVVEAFAHVRVADDDERLLPALLRPGPGRRKVRREGRAGGARANPNAAGPAHRGRIGAEGREPHGRSRKGT
mmetsp:Transcript_21811/g.64978  ORF Transcript_21811/g.64978 Transcript_21811/m.64978 type:complete len:264 (-) Transcript_21811:12-803(-)